MEARRELERFHREHTEILEFLSSWENMLDLAARDAQGDRREGLRQLQAAEGKLAAISQHCRQEEEHVESPFVLYLDLKALAQLRNEHEQLRRLTNDFLGELRFTTSSRTDELVALGRELLPLLRGHIAFEEKLLKQIEAETEAEEELLLSYTQAAE